MSKAEVWQTSQRPNEYTITEHTKNVPLVGPEKNLVLTPSHKTGSDEAIFESFG